MNSFSMQDAFAAPFSVHGLAQSERGRLPEALIPLLRPELHRLARMTSGGRIRFQTDAPRLRVEAVLADASLKTHMTPLLHSGFDLYEGAGKNACRRAVIRPAAQGGVPFEPLDGYTLDRIVCQEVALSGEMRLYTLYLPVFCALEVLRIGVPDGFEIIPAPAYALPMPIVFYGSSITQGACAGRPALTWPARVCRALDADFISLGFAGQAKGDLEIADYIATLPMSMLVMDYDHNAPDAAWLRQTHWRFYEHAASGAPQAPVLFLSRPPAAAGMEDSAMREACRAVVAESFERAAREHGARAAMVCGEALFGDAPAEDCLMDLVHPNDAGFARMADTVLPVFQELLTAGSNAHG